MFILFNEIKSVNGGCCAACEQEELGRDIVREMEQAGKKKN